MYVLCTISFLYPLSTLRSKCVHEFYIKSFTFVKKKKVVEETTPLNESADKHSYAHSYSVRTTGNYLQ